MPNSRHIFGGHTIPPRIPPIQPPSYLPPTEEAIRRVVRDELTKSHASNWGTTYARPQDVVRKLVQQEIESYVVDMDDAEIAKISRTEIERSGLALAKLSQKDWLDIRELVRVSINKKLAEAPINTVREFEFSDEEVATAATELAKAGLIELIDARIKSAMSKLSRLITNL